MIFYFESAIEDVSAIDPRVFFNAVQELIRSYRRGFHRIVIARGLCDWIVASLPLNEFDKATLLRIRNEFTQFGGVRADAEVWVEIVPNGDNIEKIDKYISLPIRFLTEKLVLDRTVLLVENAHNDGSIQRFILQNIARRKGLGRVEFEAGNGGGDALEHAARTYFNDGRLTYAIIDSDLSGPSNQIPSKVLRFNRVVNETGWVASAIVYPPCREVENLLSPVVVAMLNCSHQKKGVFSELDKIRNMEISQDMAGKFWRYFDIKDGNTVNDADAPDWLSSRMLQSGITSLEGISSKVVEIINSDNVALSAFAKEVVTEDWWSEFGSAYSIPLWATVSSVISRT